MGEQSDSGKKDQEGGWNGGRLTESLNIMGDEVGEQLKK